MKAKAALVVLNLGLALIIGQPRPAFACSCMMTTPEEAIANSEAAIVATVTDEREIGNGQFRWALEVDAVLAGDVERTIELDGTNDSAACGLGLSAGQRVGLTLYREEGRWAANSCTMQDADALMAAGEPRAPSPGEPGEPASVDNNPWALVAPIAGLALVGGGVFAAGRFRRRSE